ncbi:three-Cys-motif partner protein TcmP [Streptomyces sp. NPDC088816]|uniref:three-Cys-motif partner protein TcmP n=1 Tax=Streptomyces sp. NPDC088816 TaxID=3365906 RepID=UPI00382363CF
MSRKDELRETVWPSDAHTQVKHLVYRHYLQCWMPKILQKFREATIVDAFAGPGVYKDGAPGSSVVIARTFLEHTYRSRFGVLNLVCLEERADRVEELRRQLDKLPRDPRLRIRIQSPGAFADEQPRLTAIAHGPDQQRPVLWIVDPFDLKSIPYELVRACAMRPRDEVLVTLFTEELHRFCEKASYDQTMNRYFGGHEWADAVPVRGASSRTRAFADAYGRALSRSRLLSGHFAVRVHNRAARYHLVLGTHHEAGLKCWNPVKWKLDAYTGEGASAASVGQPDLFGEAYVGPLEKYLRGLAGRELSWTELAATATKMGHLEKHLRHALTQLAEEGVAIRTHPVAASTMWPTGSRVRFYDSLDGETEL